MIEVASTTEPVLTSASLTSVASGSCSIRIFSTCSCLTGVVIGSTMVRGSETDSITGSVTGSAIGSSVVSTTRVLVSKTGGSNSAVYSRISRPFAQFTSSKKLRKGSLIDSLLVMCK